MAALCCPLCLTDVVGKCSCGLNQPWLVQPIGKSVQAGVTYIICNMQCNGCQQARTRIPVLQKYLTPLAELDTFVDADGFLCSKKWCPTNHGEYQVGIRKSTSHRCPSCGHVDVQEIKASPELQGDRSDAEDIRRSVMGF